MKINPNGPSAPLSWASGLLPQEKLDRLISFQRKLASKVILEDDFAEEIVAGVDQAFVDFPGFKAESEFRSKFEPEFIISGAVSLDSSMHVLEKSSYFAKAKFPYIAGLLSFREGPSAIRAVSRLNSRPGILFVDGCGANHPLKAGLASYIGVALDIPTIGITKSVLCGRFDLPEIEGEASPLIFEERQVGYLLKPRKGCRPIVVGPGHKVSLESSLDLARKYLKGHKLPEPCRLAHEHANQIKKGMF